MYKILHFTCSDWHFHHNNWCMTYMNIRPFILTKHCKYLTLALFQCHWHDMSDLTGPQLWQKLTKEENKPLFYDKFITKTQNWNNKNKINLAAPYCNMNKKLFFSWHCISLIQYNGWKAPLLPIVLISFPITCQSFSVPLIFFSSC